jgi:hypothetical protein
MTTPQLTGWIKGKPLKSRPGRYEVAIAVFPLNSRRVVLLAKGRREWLGNRWESPHWLSWTHFRGLAKKP